jgi:hypothetical protein
VGHLAIRVPFVSVAYLVRRSRGISPQLTTTIQVAALTFLLLLFVLAGSQLIHLIWAAPVTYYVTRRIRMRATRILIVEPAALKLAATASTRSGVHVIVENLPTGCPGAGDVSQDVVQATVERIVRAAGIPVLNADQALKTPGGPHLSLHVQHRDGQYVATMTWIPAIWLPPKWTATISINEDIGVPGAALQLAEGFIEAYRLNQEPQP